MKMMVLASGLGTRLREESGGRSKLLVDVAGATLLDRILELARCAGLEPLVVTRPEFAADVARSGTEVLVEEQPVDLFTTLNQARGRVHGPFCWVGGDMLFTDPAPVKELVEAHLASGSFSSFFYCRTNRFKAKLRLEPVPEVAVTREREYPYSIPNFLVHSPAVFSYMEGEPPIDFLQRGIARGEPVIAREYRRPVFEIDTPEDLAAARRHYAGCPSPS